MKTTYRTEIDGNGDIVVTRSLDRKTIVFSDLLATAQDERAARSQAIRCAKQSPQYVWG